MQWHSPDTHLPTSSHWTYTLSGRFLTPTMCARHCSCRCGTGLPGCGHPSCHLAGLWVNIQDHENGPGFSSGKRDAPHLGGGVQAYLETPSQMPPDITNPININSCSCHLHMYIHVHTYTYKTWSLHVRKRHDHCVCEFIIGMRKLRHWEESSYQEAS